MNTGKTILALALSLCVVAASPSLLPAADGQPTTESAPQEKTAQAPEKAQAIDASAEIDSTHPEVEPGLTCNDCHEVKYDAKTTATQVHLYDESPGYARGEGVMDRERTWQEIVKVIGGIKHDSKTYVLGTCVNNVPLTTTCEWTLDQQNKCLYGFHEKGTEKLKHIATNSKVSMNYHEEFDSATFAQYLCVQIKGRAELIEGTDPEFDRVLIELLPYEFGARVPKDASPEVREQKLKQFRDMARGAFVISKIIPDQITILNKNFSKEAFRLYQRWNREAPSDKPPAREPLVK